MSISQVDSLVDMLTATEAQTLNERIDGKTVDLTNYEKHDGGSGTRITGKALLSNKIPNFITNFFEETPYLTHSLL